MLVWERGHTAAALEHLQGMNYSDGRDFKRRREQLRMSVTGQGTSRNPKWELLRAAPV